MHASQTRYISKYQVKLISNEQGNSKFFTLLILLLSTSLLLVFIVHHKKDFNQHQARLNTYLCHKARNSYEAQYTNEVIRKNKQITHINIMLLATVLRPELYHFFKKAKKFIQYQQEFERISYIKKILNLKRKNCFFLNYPLKTLLPGPFKGAFKLKRNYAGLAVMRTQKWKAITKGKGFILYVQSQIKEGQIFQTTKEVKYSLNLFSSFHL